MQQNQELLISSFPRHLSKQIVRCSISADAPITIMPGDDAFANIQRATIDRDSLIAG
jgi:hypothetical protein